ncbi:MAG: DUF4433 domain-containing protein [Erysipelotrichaceae bacterium]|nr:DUF4433 domain-containing protein [Erysipelotrichaceae bacterium]
MTISSQFREFDYLYNITSINNVMSILQNGLLCKNMILNQSMKFNDISNSSVQNRRNNIYIDDQLQLHDFANVYFNPRNAMLYYLIRQDLINEICILQIKKTILDLPHTIVTNQNAAVAIGTRFMTVEEAHKPGALNYDNIYRYSWYSQDPLEKDKFKKQMMAEVLVYNKIPPEYIACINVPNQKVYDALKSMGVEMKIFVNEYLFFNSKEESSQ